VSSIPPRPSLSSPARFCHFILIRSTFTTTHDYLLLVLYFGAMVPTWTVKLLTILKLPCQNMHRPACEQYSPPRLLVYLNANLEHRRKSYGRAIFLAGTIKKTVYKKRVFQYCIKIINHNIDIHSTVFFVYIFYYFFGFVKTSNCRCLTYIFT